MAKVNCKLVAYYRVSTDKQGVSGLGLEAQQSAVEVYAAKTGCTVVASYTEIESGRKKNRPELKAAIAFAKRSKASLVVAKFDRLSRNVAFLSNLMDSEVEFVALDCPDANRLTLHILAAVAEEEARLISVRTKAALAALKARGVELGNSQNLTAEAKAKGSSVNQAKAVEAYTLVTPLAQHWRSEGLSFGAIARRLNEKNVPTRQGAAWTPMAVKRMLDRSAVEV
jgi:DNA invertase Pin-like site-specific DNA recombinase